MRTKLIAPVLLAAACALSAPALAGDNDFTLQRFGQCVEGTTPDPDTGEVAPCRTTTTDDKGFRNFARELGLAIAPYGLTTGETLGPAGFAFQIDHNVTSISDDEAYWAAADVDGDPASSLGVTRLHLRKGLPFSAEVGATFGHIWGTDLFTAGGELRVALIEDLFWPAPDLTLRGFGNALVGHPQLNLYTAGMDAIVSVPVGLGGVVNVTPFFGYSLTAVFSSSRLIDATPGELDPSVENPDNPARTNRPEFVFGNESEIVHRAIAGLRLQVALLDLTFQATLLGDQTTISFAAALDF